MKRGQVKQILITQIQEELPDFEFLEYKNGCYTFERIRTISGIDVFEHFHIIFALKDRNFSCSIASRINKSYIRSSSYNTGLLNPHIDLVVLKKGTGVISLHEAYYFHNGQVKTTTKIVQQIIKDFKLYGKPFLESQLEQLEKSNLVKAGLEFIGNLNSNKKSLKLELDSDLNKGGHLISSLKNDTYLELKTLLQGIEGIDRETRKKIPKLPYELLDYYCEEKEASA
ncbi:MAG: hypothetical protein IPL46_03390 [Saprospiraceae bacterium]|nr:hypothetical protein [Saprospiraceae bacterium]